MSDATMIKRVTIYNPLANPTYLFLDIETTGLMKKRVLGDGCMECKAPHILEVCALLYNADWTLQSRFKCIIPLDEYGLKKEELEPFIQKMHTENGLFAAMEGGTSTGVYGNAFGERVSSLVSAKETWKDWTEDASSRSGDKHGKLVLLGKNIAGFDVPIMEAWGFDMSRFHHRVVDIGTLGWLGGVPKALVVPASVVTAAGVPAHRAEADCFACVEAVRGYLNPFNAKVPIAKG